MRAAFSLVELSIVLVILGLLTGGILTGQSLIRAAELRSVTTEFQRYQTAIMTFRDKYFALPGDMRNATNFWESAGGTGSDATCQAVIQTTTATCNGNGDGDIGFDNPDFEAELFLLWKHLANAGLIEGSYTGTDRTNGGFPSYHAHKDQERAGWNVPASRLGNAYWLADNKGGWNASMQNFYGPYTSSAKPYYNNSLYVFSADSNAPFGGGPFTTEEIWNIDKKLDDGFPGSGRIETLRGGLASPGSAGLCVTDPDPAVAEYDLDDTSSRCSAIFVGAFRR